jgi:acetate kinase
MAGEGILVVNCGSSSVKYQLLDMSREAVLAAGMVERIGEHGSRHRHRGEQTAGWEREVSAADHRQAFAHIGAALRACGLDAGLLQAVGHRVVHGGETFSAPVRIEAGVVAAIRRLIPLAPLHNPANLTGIEVSLEAFPQVPQVAVFDTAFHQSIPPHAHRYAVPHAWYEEHQVRRYGFHGSSHQYVAARAAAALGRPPQSVNLITLHLGNGASATAVQGGRSVDTSMGLTPLEGLVMGTRSGDLDPAIPLYLQRAAGLGAEAVDRTLNQASGLKGLCDTNDMREVLARGEAGDARARLALEMYCYRIRKYIGAYYAVLGTVDAVVFTGGVGENAAPVRATICAGLERLGIGVDPLRNAAAQGELSDIGRPDLPVRILVARTNEELQIARLARAVVAPAG